MQVFTPLASHALPDTSASLQPTPGTLLHALLQAPPDQADSLLADVLANRQPDLAMLGELVAGLFGASRYALAAMVFARWTELQPKNPEPWSNLGLCLLLLRDTDKARQLIEYALELDPSFIAARYNLGDVYKELGQQEARLANARACVALQPAAAIAHNNLGTALQDIGQSYAAKQAFLQALQCDPGYFEAQFNLARLASDQGDTASATAFFEQARAWPGLDPQRRELVEYHLAYEYLTEGRLSEGWDLYEHGFSPLVPLSIARRPDRHFTVPQWDGRPLEPGQTLMLWREQGIGDELRFLSLLPLLDTGEGRLIIETEARLVDMLQRSFPHASVRVQQMSEGDGGQQTMHDYDLQLPVGSLPQLLMRDASVYDRLGAWLKAAPAQRERFAQRLAALEGKRKVGICWRSHQLSATRNRKYTALTDWQDVLATPDTVFVNLQYGDCEAELQAMEQTLGISILRWPDVNLKDDLEAVLGIMANLDLVISPSTAVLPMAGAIGVPAIFLGHQTWMLLGEKHRYPWFSSVQTIVVPATEMVSSCLNQVPALMQRILWPAPIRNDSVA